MLCVDDAGVRGTMPTTYTCPSCGQALWISDISATPITCPMCLKSVPGPGAGNRFEMQPRDVLPVEADVRNDQSGITRALGVLGLVLLAGGIWATIRGADLLII